MGTYGWLIPHGILIAVLTAFLVYLFGTKEQHFKSFFVLAVFCSIIVLMGKMYGILSTSVEEYLLANKIEYLGKCFMPVFALIFIVRYYRIKVPRIAIYSLVLVNALFYTVIATNEWHYLYYSSVSDTRASGALDYELGHGPLYLAYMFTLFVTLLSYIAVCLYHYFSEGKKHKAPVMQFILATGGIMPFLGILAFVSGLTHDTDTTPLGIGLAATIMSFAVVKYGLFDPIQFATEATLENTETGVVVFDKYKKFLYANNIAKGIYPNVDFDKTLVEGYEVESLFATPGRVIERGEKSYEIRTSDIVKYGRVEGYMAYFVDVTDHYYRLMELEELRDKAEQTASARTMFLANMAHEIRTPMNAIAGMTELALEKDMSDELRGDLEMIKAAGESLLSTVNDVLDVSKMEMGKFEITNGEYGIVRLLEEVRVMLAGKADDKGLALSFNIDPEIPSTLYGDDIRIKQVLINLVNNAIKYTDEGSVSVRVRQHRDQNADAISLEFSVRDTGIGVKAEDRERIFGTFEQTDQVHNHKIEGTGLGLSICKQLVSLMGGTIGVDSAYGKGSRFYFEIPQKIVSAQPVGADAMALSAQASDVEFSNVKARLLVVDDNRVNLTVAQGLFGKVGLDIDTAVSGEDAVEKARFADYDIIFIDRMMPGMDGIETARALRAIGERYETVPFVAFSADISATSRREFDDAGFADYLEKPLRIDSIKLVLKRWLKN